MLFRLYDQSRSAAVLFSSQTHPPSLGAHYPYRIVRCLVHTLRGEHSLFSHFFCILIPCVVFVVLPPPLTVLFYPQRSTPGVRPSSRRAASR